ncbi:copper-binding protein [Salmonella enterica subsp. enterica serovar Montevideo]|nr:copper-binding protein [Salmonella enterica subsp. enterica serovar Montevideo]
MKKILVSFVAIMAAASSAMAAETMNMHDQVNNAQAPAHQMQSSAEKSAIQGDSMTMMDMSSHDQAAMSHDMMQNSNSAAHQDMAEMHKKMMKAKPGATNETAKSFSEMSEHEKAAAVHEKVNNGQSSVVHQQQADKHRSQITQN